MLAYLAAARAACCGGSVPDGRAQVAAWVAVLHLPVGHEYVDGVPLQDGF
jgi:hypothetical protein